MREKGFGNMSEEEVRRVKVVIVKKENGGVAMVEQGRSGSRKGTETTWTTISRQAAPTTGT